MTTCPTLWAMSTTVEPNAAKTIKPAARRWPAALTLAILAPLIAELGVGSIPASKAWTLPFFGYVYSAGALLIREVVLAGASGSVRCWLSVWRTGSSKKAWR